MGEPRRRQYTRTLQADVHASDVELAHYLAEACDLFPQTSAAYATRDYNSQTRKPGLPFPRLSPPRRADVDSLIDKVHKPAFDAQHSGPYSSMCPARQPADLLNCPQAITGSMRFPWNSFKYFSPSFQSSFHLSFTLLLRYRSPRNI